MPVFCDFERDLLYLVVVVDTVGQSLLGNCLRSHVCRGLMVIAQRFNFDQEVFPDVSRLGIKIYTIGSGVQNVAGCQKVDVK